MDPEEPIFQSPRSIRALLFLVNRDVFLELLERAAPSGGAGREKTNLDVVRVARQVLVQERTGRPEIALLDCFERGIVIRAAPGSANQIDDHAYAQNEAKRKYDKNPARGSSHAFTNCPTCRDCESASVRNSTRSTGRLK